jgi:hypothetical protein
MPRAGIHLRICDAITVKAPIFIATILKGTPISIACIDESKSNPARFV